MPSVIDLELSNRMGTIVKYLLQLLLWECLFESRSKCNQYDQCDSFTSKPIADPNNGQSICELYAVLRDNKCIANVTQVTSVGVSIFKSN